MKQRVLVSQCLLGIPCRYDGKSAGIEAIRMLASSNGWIPVCPEILGGLTTPRCPAERKGSLVITKDGSDVTDAYTRGAEQAFALCRLYNTRFALLKERSPSCGCGIIYDGSFTGVKTEGDGVTAQLLKAHGIRIYGESRLTEMLEEIKRMDEHDSL